MEMEMKLDLGQYMTPDQVCHLLTKKVVGKFDEVVDLAAGNCRLLSAFASAFPSAKLFGIDIDKGILKDGLLNVPKANLFQGNGLTFTLPATPSRNSRLIVGNPPYGNTEKLSKQTESAIARAFPGLKTKKGKYRLEIQFLAKCLNLLREKPGCLVIVLPVSFADGETYKEYRRVLTTEYCVEAAIEFSADIFHKTEAKTVALIVSYSPSQKCQTKISEFNLATGAEKKVFTGYMKDGARLDAKFYKRAKEWTKYVKLEDLGVSISRGKHSNKQATALELSPIHTSDLARSSNGKIVIPKIQANMDYMENGYQDTFAQAGDILLSRTGNRVSWDPVIVVRGKAPITDHVFCIRLPKNHRKKALESFQHPRFQDWLRAVCKGVCATVLTKQDLLKMPVFSMAS